MFEIHVTSEARPVLRNAIAQVSGARAGVTISRQGPVGDVKRGASGEALWLIEHRHPWQLEIQSLEPIPDAELVHVDEFRFWLALIPRPTEGGVVISINDGRLHVDEWHG